jgi:hypothetical protein
LTPGLYLSRVSGGRAAGLRPHFPRSRGPLEEKVNVHEPRPPTDMPPNPIDARFPPLDEVLSGIDEGLVRSQEGRKEPREPRQLGTESHLKAVGLKINVGISWPPLHAPHVSVDVHANPAPVRPSPRVERRMKTVGAHVNGAEGLMNGVERCVSADKPRMGRVGRLLTAWRSLQRWEEKVANRVPWPMKGRQTLVKRGKTCPSRVKRVLNVEPKRRNRAQPPVKGAEEVTSQPTTSTA